MSEPGFLPNGIAGEPLRVACIRMDELGPTLIVPASELAQHLDDGDGFQQRVFVSFKTMTVGEYKALGEFNGF